MRLLTSTGSDQTDAVLRETIEAFSRALPGRVRACYLHGSVAEGASLATSDLDLAIVFCGAWQSVDEQHTAERLRDQCVSRCPLELDIELGIEAELAGGMDPNLKLASRLIYGTDIREAFPLVPIEAWARDRLHSSYWRIIMLFGRPVPVTTPLTYPDDRDEFYGYLRRKTRLPDGSVAIGTRDLVRSTGWAATALLALQDGTYVTRKRDCHRLYSERIGDEWTPLLAAIYDQCRDAWSYLVPAAPTDRRELRALCGRTLSFESHFLSVYREYLRAELTSGDPARTGPAREIMRRVPWSDASIEAALDA